MNSDQRFWIIFTTIVMLGIGEIGFLLYLSSEHQHDRLAECIKTHPIEECHRTFGDGSR